MVFSGTDSPALITSGNKAASLGGFPWLFLQGDLGREIVKKQDWRPNWKNPKEYPAPETTSMFQWAWEFLRRNPDYIRDYDEYSTDDMDELSPETRNEILQGKRRLSKYWSVNGCCFDGEFLNDVQRKIGAPVGSLPETEQHLGKERCFSFVCTPGLSLDHTSAILSKKYGLKNWDFNLPDPARNYTYSAQSFSDIEGAKFEFDTGILKFGPPVPGITLDGKEQYKTDGREFPIWFDLSVPIDVQIEKAKMMLEKAMVMFLEKNRIEEKVKRNKTIYDYPIHLRILDASYAGAHLDEMAALIYPGEDNIEATGWRARKKIDQKRKVAEKFMMKDYLFLASVG